MLSNERKRSIDIDSLSKEQANSLADQIGEKIREICDKAVEKSNRVLNIYGMEAKMQILVAKIGNMEPKTVKTVKTKKTKKIKDLKA